jgi:peptide-methionine (R)-S-oxide reductase
MTDTPASGFPRRRRIPIDQSNVVEKLDLSYGMVRREVRSVHGDSHLGHVFDEGPAGAGGLRYCMNSAALRFIPVAELEA